MRRERVVSTGSSRRRLTRSRASAGSWRAPSRERERMLEERAGRPSRRVDERLRRLRRTEGIRQLLKESRVHASNLMAPVFVKDGARVVEPVEAMPGINRYSVDTLSEYVGRLVDEGVK